MSPDLEQAFAQIAEHTLEKCANACTRPYGCCSADNCRTAMEMAQEMFGVAYKPTAHPTLPMMDATGCIMPPHHRPLCAVHVCERHLNQQDAWTDRYWELRDRADEALVDSLS